MKLNNDSKFPGVSSPRPNTLVYRDFTAIVTFDLAHSLLVIEHEVLGRMKGQIAGELIKNFIKAVDAYYEAK